MNETLAEELKKLAQVMHFFGQYTLCNNLTALAVWCETHGIESIGDLPDDEVKNDPT